MSDTTLQSLTAAVSAETMMRNLEALASRVKLAGTPEELESLRVIEARMQDYGYRTTILQHPAFISLPGAARLSVGQQELPCITHSFSLPTGPEGVTAALVDLGQGSAADFQNKDLRGRIALIEGMANPASAARARDVGALGQLHISPDDQLHEMCISPVWGSPSDATRGQLPRTVAITVERQAGLALRERLRTGEALSVTLFADVDTGWRNTPILVAELDAPGAGVDAPFVMFSGHHDTWHFGVMDNGAANATMMEVARLCAGRQQDWRRGLRFCFWSGHSQGRYSGSAWYADEYWDELDRRCVAHVNTDSTGGRGADDLAHSGAAAELWGLAADAVGAQAGQSYARVRSGRNGDQSFWGVGIPAIFNSLSRHARPDHVAAQAHMPLGWWWHTPHDTLDKIDPERLVRDTRVFVHVVWRLLSTPLLPLNYAEHARSLRAELEPLRDGLSGVLDLSLLASRAAALEDAASAFATRAAAMPEEALPALDGALMRASRALVPLDYTQGDRFRHDPALEQHAWPSLQPLRQLLKAAGTAEAPFLLVAARQARNCAAHALRQATEALAAAG
ncbi:M28 family peptidase [Roseomonas elaeocarpi]|uniref:M28 family peptidase n=1 Tax=Roseomonas elaeocarpi TaxID=907779 RepID=A0ABV6JNA7_9PROT